jgi:hypothetical protein
MPHTKADRDQFEIGRNSLRHRPTNASFTSYPGRDKEIATVNWGMLGNRLHNGDDYSQDEVLKIAMELMAEQETGS